MHPTTLRIHHRLVLASTLAAAAALGACKGGEKQPAAESTAAAAAPSDNAATAAGGPIEPGPGGKVIVVEMITDETGNYFKPKEIEAHPNDVVRYTLTAGVHNVDFLPDSNPGKTGLPKASEMLQLPGQTFDVAAKGLAPGKYYFQCDPHAALGMRGKLEVEKD
jgi:plastocyanin